MNVIFSTLIIIITVIIIHVFKLSYTFYIKVDEDEVKDEEAEITEDYACKKCGQPDHPEWILLCDKCDSGYHASCLRPTLMLIPEGDWFCPPCQHVRIL